MVNEQLSWKNKLKNNLKSIIMVGLILMLAYSVIIGNRPYIPSYMSQNFTCHGGCDLCMPIQANSFYCCQELDDGNSTLGRCNLQKQLFLWNGTTYYQVMDEVRGG